MNEEQCWPDLRRDLFLWRDQKGGKWPLWMMSNHYVANIIGFLGKKLVTEVDELRRDYWSHVRRFLLEEQAIRAKEAKK